MPKQDENGYVYMTTAISSMKKQRQGKFPSVMSIYDTYDFNTGQTMEECGCKMQCRYEG